MANLARGVLRRKLEPLAFAGGRFGEHHRYLLALHLRRLKAMQAELAELEARIEERVRAFQHQRDWLLQIPGIDRSIASSILTGPSGKLPYFRAVPSWRSPDATATAARAERGGADGG